MAGGGTLGDNIGLKEEVIKKACGLAFKAHKSPEKPFQQDKTRGSPEVIFSFPGSWDDADWFNNKPFGETKIDLMLFPSLRSIGNDEAALVNEAFLLRFESILSNSSLKSEVNKAVAEGKQIVFTGHSSGAAMAILATFWALEEYHNPNKTQNHKHPFCVTFGSPLVGNRIFSHAARRENWSRQFIHFVMRFDIVPRILLAPFSAIDQSLSSILPFLNPKNKPSPNDATRRASVTSEFYLAVIRNAATVTSHAACNLMGSTNLLLETLTNFVDLSPYRPFGTNIFCTGNGQLVVIRNSDAVLQLLFYSAQPSDLAEASDVAKKSIQEHLGYEDELQESLGMQRVVYLDQLEELPLSPNGSGSDIATVDAALNDLGLSTRARLCLRAAGEMEKQKSRNEGKIDKKKAKESMEEMEKYKQICEHKGGYYDAFKLQKESRDFQANVKRLVLAGVWDEVIEMLKRYELPDEFEGNPEWIRLGTSFRRLVEPLDIANYYRHLKNEDTGPYMVKARPKRYRYTQRWLEHATRTTNEAYSESCFLAEVEELSIRTNSNRSFEHISERVQQLEQNIKKWIDKGELIARDVFLRDSSFVKWWNTLPNEHKATSCIASFIHV